MHRLQVGGSELLRERVGHTCSTAQGPQTLDIVSRTPTSAFRLPTAVDFEYPCCPEADPELAVRAQGAGTV